MGARIFPAWTMEVYTTAPGMREKTSDFVCPGEARLQRWSPFGKSCRWSLGQLFQRHTAIRWDLPMIPITFLYTTSFIFPFTQCVSNSAYLTNATSHGKTRKDGRRKILTTRGHILKSIPRSSSYHPEIKIPFKSIGLHANRHIEIKSNAEIHIQNATQLPW